eukprot:TRINITY_DN48084_c0_g1_i1.p1 TRINITY_DN48084_c0_g1~~TRINITY_DN48084_c0_g1_i1.p1  ORF type:complete len:194 (-),score=26.49 TRINITY_DN48084_c0_g1_i1:436-1017(-)
MAHALIILCMLAAGSHAVDISGNVELRTALASNDPCIAADGTNEACALSALQLKGAMSSQANDELDDAPAVTEPDESLPEANDTDAVTDTVLHSSVDLAGACHGSWSKKLAEMAPKCLRSCPQLCGPLDKAITSYLTKGGGPALDKVLCHYTHQYSCAIGSRNYGKCSGLIHKASGFGISLPTSHGALRRKCR